MREWPSATIVSMISSCGAVAGSALIVDARDHDLVHALLPQLEHRADHLLLLGLDDALLASALDEDHQLLGRDPLLLLLA